MLVLAVFLFLLFTYVTLALRSGGIQVAGARTRHEREQARWLAEAGIQKALSCLSSASAAASCGGQTGFAYVGETFSLAGGEVEVEVAGEGLTRVIRSAGAYRGAERVVTIQARKFLSVGIAHAMSGGGSGATLKNNTSIVGSVYLNGPITCGANALIDGDVTLAGTSTLRGCEVRGDVRAHEIRDAEISGDAYYQVIAGSDVDGTLHPGSPDPEPVAPPIDEATIAFWKDVAEAGGVIDGDVVLYDESAALGPVLIRGDLTVENNVDLTFGGIVYVEGDVRMRNNIDLRLHPDYGDAAGLLALDGSLVINNNLTFHGSGQADSVMLFVSRSPSLNPAAPAIRLENNIESSVFATTQGLIVVGNNTAVTSLLAEKLQLENNASATYLPIIGDVQVGTGGLVPELAWVETPGSRSE